MYSKKPPVEMKPCPFCGGEAEAYEHSHGLAYAVCKDCGGSGPSRSSRWNASRAWNKRVNKAASV